MKSIFIKSACFSAIAAILFFALYYGTGMAIFNFLFDISIIATAFCFLAFIFCLIFKKEISSTKNTDDDYIAK